MSNKGKRHLNKLLRWAELYDEIACGRSINGDQVRARVRGLEARAASTRKGAQK